MMYLIYDLLGSNPTHKMRAVIRLVCAGESPAPGALALKGGLNHVGSRLIEA